MNTGGGVLSSSDGQRFPARGKSITARALSRYSVDEGISTYTHVSGITTAGHAAGVRLDGLKCSIDRRTRYAESSDQLGY